MLTLWLFAALLLLIGFVIVWYPLWGITKKKDSSQPGQPVTASALNIQVYREQLSDLSADYHAGRLEEQEYRALTAELQRSILADTEAPAAATVESAGGTMYSRSFLLPLILSLLVGGLAAGLYWELGSSGTLASMQAQRDFADRLSRVSGQERVSLLQQRLAGSEAAEQPDIWYSLAREHLSLQQHEAAQQAYEQLLALVGEQPGILAEYAQALFLVSGNRVTPQVRRLLDRTISAQPENATALGMLGIDAFENKRYAQAIEYWQGILDTAPDLAGAQALRTGIARAQAALKQAGESTAETKPDAAVAPGEAAVQVELLVEIGLEPALAARVQQSDTLFVFARAVEGPPMPLAAARLTAGSLPATVVLDDSRAMSPMAKLSSAEQVQVVARISKSGTPQAQPGDLQGVFGPIAVKGRTAIKILINNVVE